MNIGFKSSQALTAFLCAPTTNAASATLGTGSSLKTATDDCGAAGKLAVDNNAAMAAAAAAAATAAAVDAAAAIAAVDAAVTKDARVAMSGADREAIVAAALEAAKEARGAHKTV